MPIKLDLLPAVEAVQSLEAKGYTLSFDWRDVYAEEHAKSFTVAKMMRVDLLQTVHEALIRAENEGWDLKRFSQQLRPILEKEGWWGRQKTVDTATGEIVEAQLGSPNRLRTIFDTNLRTSYSAGRWMRGERSANRLPILLYRTMRDARVRPLHARWDGLALPRTDAFWDTHYPPNGWRCRCIAYPISEDDIQRLKTAFEESGRGIEIKTQAPPIETLQWVNPRTGEVRYVPVGIDPGFDYNPGKAAKAHLDKLLAEKEAAFAQAAPAAAETVALASVSAFVRGCLDAPRDKQAPLDLGLTARDEAVGIPVAGKSVGLDHDYARHALLHHGTEKERLRGQEPIAAEDFALARQLFDAPTATIEPGDPPVSKNGTARIQVKVDMNGWHYTAVYEVRRARMVLYTLFKRRK
jgi:SPP1 gp7 family putative phage head morphogenesis protein